MTLFSANWSVFSRRVFRGGIGLCLILAVSLCQGAPLAEYKVKAAFLLKFADFVEWPMRTEIASEPLQLGVIGPDPFGPLLPEEISADEPNGLAFRVSRLSGFERAPVPFQMLFFPEPDQDGVPSMLQKIADQPVLTIGEGESFVQNGGIIAFTMENNRVRFLVNLKNARRAGLVISSQLLDLARKVYQ